MPDGSEKPAMFASRSLTKTERNYSQIDKEALSIVWGVKRFYQYLFGQHFDLVTDHKPLVSIFAPNRSLPCLSATRMVPYALFLQAFSYTIKYRNTKNHGNADALSRLPLAVDKDCEYLTEADGTNMSQVELMPVTVTDIARATKTDRKLFELNESLKSGTELPVPWKAPYHPATNGQAERIVQLFKASLKSSRGDSGDLNVKLQRFLLQYRITPHSLTGETPSALFLKRCICTRLDLFKPNLRDKVVQKQSSRLDTESILREFQEGEKVAVRNYSGPNKWKVGTIINRDGTLSYSIQIGNEIWKRHVDQIRKCGKSIELSQAATEIPIYDKELNFPDEPVSDDVAESEPPAPVPKVVPKPKDVPVPATPSDDIPPKPVPDASGKPKTDVPLRRSNRIRRPPKRFDL
ncbi:uncharacterized protein TNCV_4659371 [Trichonephila clavipes]|nr:uncharacterized protein TNCV_4659371 [Trichonephila clavipes]